MSRRRWVQTVDIRPDCVVVTGWQAADYLRAFGLRPTWSTAERGWILNRRRAGDAVAALECSPAALRITGEELEVPEAAREAESASVEPVAEEDAQLSLWEAS